MVCNVVTYRFPAQSDLACSARAATLPPTRRALLRASAPPSCSGSPQLRVGSPVLEPPEAALHTTSSLDRYDEYGLPYDSGAEMPHPDYPYLSEAPRSDYPY